MTEKQNIKRNLNTVKLKKWGQHWPDGKHDESRHPEAVSSSKCNELMMMLKQVKLVRQKQFFKAITRTGIKLLG